MEESLLNLKFNIKKGVKEFNETISYKDIVIKTVTNQFDLLETFKLRYETYCLKGKKIDSSQFSDQLEFDEYDSYGHHAIILQKKKLLALFEYIIEIFL